MFLKLILSIQMAFGAMTLPPTSAEKAYLGWKNQMSNPGFEQGKAGWTVTTTAFTITTTSTEIFEGARAAEWNPAGAESLSSPGWTPATNAGGNGVGFAAVRSNADADYNLEIYDGSAVVATVDIAASTTYQLIPLTFAATGGTTYKVRVTSAGDDDEIQVDGFGIGYAAGYNVGSVSQAELVGTATWTGVASCSWSTTSASFANFAADADCNNPSVTGSVSAPGTKIPAVVLNNIGPGNYFFIAQGLFQMTTTASAGWRFSDGTNHGNTNTVNNQGSAVNTSALGTITGWIPYTTGQSSVTVNIQGFLASGTATYVTAAVATNQNLSIQVYRYPLASETVFRADTIAQSWSGYHGNTCSWARTNTSLGDPTADATCSLTQQTNTNFGTVVTYDSGGSALPGITFPPKFVGKYFVCAVTKAFVSTTGTATLSLTDGTTEIVSSEMGEDASGLRDGMSLCGIYDNANLNAKTLRIQTAASAGTVTVSAGVNQAVYWSIYAITQAMPAPLIKQSVVNTSSGVTGVEAANIDCDAGSSIVAQQGSWVSSVGNISGGACALTLSAGTFSGTPYCTANTNETFASVGAILDVRATSATAVSVDCETDASGECSSFDFNIICVGPR